MFQFIGVLGAVLVIIAFFLSWGTFAPIIGDSIHYTGMDFFDKEVILADVDAWQNMIPMVALILAIIALIISVVPGEYLGGVKTEKILGITSIVVAIVLLVIIALFMVWFSEFTGNIILGLGEVSFGAGAYLGLIGSILVFIVGVLPLFKSSE